MHEWIVRRMEDVASLVRTSHCSANAADLLMALVRGQARSTAAPRRFGSVRLIQCIAPGESRASRPSLALDAQRMLSQRGGSEMPGKDRTLKGPLSAIERK